MYQTEKRKMYFYGTLVQKITHDVVYEAYNCPVCSIMQQKYKYTCTKTVLHERQFHIDLQSLYTLLSIIMQATAGKYHIVSLLSHH